MPTYEYACQKCGERFELFQSFAAKSLKKHDVCGGPLQKVFHKTGVMFKGSGFYINDSRRKVGTSSTTSDSGNGSSKKESSSSDKNTEKNGATTTEKSKSKKVSATKSEHKSE